MSSVRGLRVWLTSAALMLLGIGLAVLASPTASAALREDRTATGPAAPTPTTVTSLPPGSTPRMLATTGLDITVPVMFGLAILIVGTVMVGWAFLATGRRTSEAGEAPRR